MLYAIVSSIPLLGRFVCITIIICDGNNTGTNVSLCIMNTIFITEVTVLNSYY